jgi:thiamine-monophosphate kinase
MNEFDFIRRLREQTRSRQHSPRLKVGIGDDAAVIRQYSDRDFVLTTDLIVEGIDFLPEVTPPRLLGHKSLAVSLSDIAAMGARPRWTLVSVGFPPEVWNGEYRDEVFAGYLALASHYGISLAGGDVSRSRQIIIDSILVGEVTTGRAVLRSTARPGDQIFVTGALGGAAAGLKLIELGARVSDGRLQTADGSSPAASNPTLVAPAAAATVLVSEPPAVAGGPVSALDAIVTGSTEDYDAIQSLLLRHLAPEPRVGWGIVLGEEGLATSMIDLSDGLSSDLHHICEESNVGALIDAASLPLNEDVVQLCGRRALDPLSLALHGGEDFELLFTVAPENVARLPKLVDGVPIGHVGEVTSEAGVIRVNEKNREWQLPAQGFKHFRNSLDEAPTPA